MERPHAAAERFAPIPDPARAGEHAHRGGRAEPLELARRRDRAGSRASPVEEARAGRGGAAPPLQRWRDEAARAGRSVTRVAAAFEAGRDGFWLARWLRARDVEAH